MSQFVFDGNSNKADLGLACYPVGSIYMSLNSTNPAELFGGTWQPLDEGRVLIGANSSYPVNSKGGEATHVLTEGEMPSHVHDGTTAQDGSHSHTLSLCTTSVKEGIQYMYPYDYNNFTIIMLNYQSDVSQREWYSPTDKILSVNNTGNHNHSFLTNSTGLSSPHNNMQPYLAVYMWYRTA